MKLKRLNHHVQNIGQMFCGQYLMFDYKTLVDLSEGLLFLYFLTKKWIHNNMSIQALKIVSIMQNLLIKDLSGNNININEIVCAELQVEFSTKRQLGQKKRKSIWADPTPYFIDCQLNCKSKILIKSHEYKKYLQ